MQLAFSQSALPFDIRKQTNWNFELSGSLILIAGTENHCMNIPLFTHFSVDGLRGCFWFFTLKTNPQ